MVVKGIAGAAILGGLFAGMNGVLVALALPIAVLSGVLIGLSASILTGIVAAAFIAGSLGLFGGMAAGILLGGINGLLAHGAIQGRELSINSIGLAVIVSGEAFLGAYCGYQSVFTGMLGAPMGPLLAGAMAGSIGYLTLGQACTFLLAMRQNSLEYAVLGPEPTSFNLLEPPLR